MSPDALRGEIDAENRMMTMTNEELKRAAGLFATVAADGMALTSYHAAYANRMIREARKLRLIEN